MGKETECDLFQSIYTQCAVTLLQLQIQFSLYTYTWASWIVETPKTDNREIFNGSWESEMTIFRKFLMRICVFLPLSTLTHKYRYSVENASNLFDTFEPSMWYLFKCIFVKCGRLICPPVQAAGWEIYEAIFFKYCRINYLPGANWVKGPPSHPYVQRQMQTQLRKHKQSQKSRTIDHLPPVGTNRANWVKYKHWQRQKQRQSIAILLIFFISVKQSVWVNSKLYDLRLNASSSIPRNFPWESILDWECSKEASQKWFWGLEPQCNGGTNTIQIQIHRGNTKP